MMGMMEAAFLEGLAKDSYWEFFSRHAFGSQNPEEHPELEVIGKKIAGRLKGSPLAAKTLGGLLNSDLHERHWRNIMNSEIWELKQGRISPWMAQSFIAPQGNMRIEVVGSEYFHDLLGRSFFECSFWKDKYVMHDLIHDLVQSVSVDEHQRIEDVKWQEIPSRIRHLSICTKNLELSQLADFGNYKNLRTLVFVNLYDANLDSMLDCLFTRLTNIRVLRLRKCGIQELPGSIGKLKLLRYLDVSENNIPRLPESLCNLYNLLVLNISDCLIENFPARMTNLVKLRQLVADAKTICKLADIGKLTSLQELPNFKVEKQRGHKIEELKDMMQLHGRLRIENLENVESREEANQAKLNGKHYIDELELVWNSSGNDDEVLEGLKPHSDLGRLEIRNYGGVRFPSWLDPQSLGSLKAIFPENIQSCEQVPSIGQLSFLKILHIKNMHAVKLVGHEFYGSPEVKGFPSLEELRISGMPAWEEWFGTEGIQMFPCLLKLHVEDCPKLKGLASLA
ncbi:putative disease resistance RPP13-like protein 1 [Cocos nucifera]|uniref:Putative disease resistance RPP13-like protein 1 n=1 Tax=Cocos nucifera TaxID=13894 RepID=A0A8K0IWS2_COCNU|nr:putative disease resistance RPP13-like protein 1 [Cocos nucifera]